MASAASLAFDLPVGGAADLDLEAPTSTAEIDLEELEEGLEQAIAAPATLSSSPIRAVDPYVELLSGKRKRVEEARTLAEVERASSEAARELQALHGEHKRRLKELTTRNARIWTEDFKKPGVHPLQIHGAPPPQTLLAKYGAFLRRHLTGEADMSLLRQKLLAWREAQRRDGVEVSEVLLAIKQLSEHLDVLGDDYQDFEAALAAVLGFLDRRLRPEREAPRSRVLANITID